MLRWGEGNVAWGLTTNTPAFTSNGRFLIKPDDFKGAKSRGLIPAFNASLQALGAVPASIAGSKVCQALAPRVIGAGLTDLAATVSRKYYEVQDRFTITPIKSANFYGHVNPKCYDGLSGQARAALKLAGAKAAFWAIAASIETSAKAPNQLRAQGSKRHIANAADIKAREAVVRPAFDKVFKQENPGRKKLIKLLKKR